MSFSVSGMVATSLTCCTAVQLGSPPRRADQHAEKHREIAQPGPVHQQDHGHRQHANDGRLDVPLAQMEERVDALTTLLELCAA